MNYNIIVAISENNGIGYNNTLPWNIKEDLKIFSKLTRGNNNNAIIMGRNTFESLPNKFLPKRDNLILSSCIIIDEKREEHIIKTFDNIDSIIKFCNTKNYQEVWIIGGQLIYESFLRKHIVSRLFITKINKKYLCDKFFYYNEKDWKITAKEKLENIENIDIDLLIYEK